MSTTRITHTAFFARVFSPFIPLASHPRDTTHTLPPLGVCVCVVALPCVLLVSVEDIASKVEEPNPCPINTEQSTVA